MPWIWSCHKCHTRYLLGATRRCLVDGHYFCGGITVDKISGRLKKHRACISEFDYSGWADFGAWRSATTGQVVRRDSKHCEDECNFPSSCHWKEQQAYQEVGSGLPGPNGLDLEPGTFPVKGKLTVPKGSENYIGKSRSTSEKRAMEVAKVFLSPIEEEDQEASTCLDTRRRMNGLGFHFPVMEFSSSKNGVNKYPGLVDESQMNFSVPQSPQMSARVDKVWEDDVDMTDWITPDDVDSGSISPCAQPDAIQVPFDFKLEQDQRSSRNLADDDSTTSAMGNAWNWTAGGIGIALSPPALPVGDEMWEDEMGDANVLWDKLRGKHKGV